MCFKVVLNSGVGRWAIPTGGAQKTSLKGGLSQKEWKDFQRGFRFFRETVLPPENTRKPKVFWCLQGGKEINQ